MEYTPEQQQDFAERATAFKEAYQALLEAHQVELIHAVVTVPGPSNMFALAVNESIGDTKYKPVPSPFNVPAAKSPEEDSDAVAS